MEGNIMSFFKQKVVTKPTKKKAKSKKENYDGKKHSKDENKLWANNFLADLCYSERVKGQAIILDSEALLTTKTLVRAGFKRANIHIPNPFVYEEIKRKHRNTYNCLLSEFLDNHKHLAGKVSLAFLDFMDTLDGSDVKDRHPKDDIKKFFSDKYPNEDCVLGITISLRNPKTNGVGADVNNLNYIVSRFAYENGYHAVCLPGGKGYKGGMFFSAYRIIKAH